MVGDLKTLNILGIMSGTSLDGLDLAFCSFSRIKSIWNYKILKAVTISYSHEINNSLNNAINLPAEELCMLDHAYGKWIGNTTKKLLEDNSLEAHYIASHGHTVFHQPSKAFTLQIGNGNDINAITGIPVICDFRSMDVALGGQGAPLVPAGDEYLFGEYDYCLNLGGFSNISFKKDGKRIAFDICPVNMGLNYLASKLGFGYDRDGNSGRKGKNIPVIIDKLNNLDFYCQKPPKSLGREWFIQNVEPILNSNNDLNDILRSLYEHISEQISRILNANKGKNVLITGGAGFIGSHLCELFLAKGFQVLCMDNLITGNI